MSEALAARGRASWLTWRHRWGLAALRSSGLFDVRDYLRRYPDVAASGVEPAIHYLRSGWREGRDPHPLFDVRRYLSDHPQVRTSGGEPLLHFIARAGRDIRPGLGRVLVLADAGDPGGGVRQIEDAVAELGANAVSATTADWRRWEAALAACASVVFWKTPAEGEGALALLRALQYGRRRFWATDDLCFDPNLYLQAAAFDALPEERRRSVIAAAPPRRAALAACDAAVVPAAPVDGLSEALLAAGAARVIRVGEGGERTTLAGALGL